MKQPPPARRCDECLGFDSIRYECRHPDAPDDPSVTGNGFPTWCPLPDADSVCPSCGKQANYPASGFCRCHLQQEPKPLSDGRILVEVGPSQWCEKEPKPRDEITGELCTCPPACGPSCKGECGCEVCRCAYGDFLSVE